MSPPLKLFDLCFTLEYLKLYPQCEGEGMATERFHSGQRSSQMESGRQFVQYTETCAAVLEEIAAKCGFKVSFNATDQISLSSSSISLPYVVFLHLFLGGVQVNSM